jgi:hypothetical protein
LAPVITGGLGVPVVRSAVDGVTGLGTATMNISCSPDVLPEQRVTFTLGSREVPANAHPVKTSALTFVATNMAAGSYLVRLSIDGVESILIDRTNPDNLKFDPTQTLELT